MHFMYCLFYISSHPQELHKEINKRIEQSNASYKLNVDRKKRFKEFEVEDFVMVRIRPRRFPQGSVKKLHAKSARPFKIISKINSNNYVLDLLKGFNINHTFNIEYLVAFDELEFNPNNPLHDEPFVNLLSENPSLPSVPNLPHSSNVEKIEAILNDEIISTKEGGRQRYLVHWEGKSVTEDTWIERDELQGLDLYLLELYDVLEMFNR
ncbi:hypothetical protein MA16_Dca009218 [Dendrobium catenatum]|uniref:Chromo domain-containing protein n=1 Tax=Dendrobium catenatum TaxID=906689 RepID=A0A2I0VR47_9ASPA|nr:hypothetical protein MA16_Dca009218 [Dendrobium catenatum]